MRRFGFRTRRRNSNQCQELHLKKPSAIPRPFQVMSTTSRVQHHFETFQLMGHSMVHCDFLNKCHDMFKLDHITASFFLVHDRWQMSASYLKQVVLHCNSIMLVSVIFSSEKIQRRRVVVVLRHRISFVISRTRKVESLYKGWQLLHRSLHCAWGNGFAPNIIRMPTKITSSALAKQSTYSLNFPRVSTTVKLSNLNQRIFQTWEWSCSKQRLNLSHNSSLCT